MTVRVSVQGATFSMSDQLYRGYANDTALVLSSGRLSPMRALHLDIAEETLDSR